MANEEDFEAFIEGNKVDYMLSKLDLLVIPVDDLILEDTEIEKTIRNINKRIYDYDQETKITLLEFKNQLELNKVYKKLETVLNQDFQELSRYNAKIRGLKSALAFETRNLEEDDYNIEDAIEHFKKNDVEDLKSLNLFKNLSYLNSLIKNSIELKAEKINKLGNDRNVTVVEKQETQQSQQQKPVQTEEQEEEWKKMQPMNLDELIKYSEALKIKLKEKEKKALIKQETLEFLKARLETLKNENLNARQYIAYLFERIDRELTSYYTLTAELNNISITNITASALHDKHIEAYELLKERLNEGVEPRKIEELVKLVKQTQQIINND